MNEQITDTIANLMQSNKELKLSISEMNNALSRLNGAIRADIDKQVDEAYQRGYEDGKADVERGCNKCRWESEGFNGVHCKNCKRSYMDRYERMPEQDDEIKVGDEVGYYGVADEHGNVCYSGVVLEIREDDYLVMEKTGKTYALKKKLVMSKTDRHFDIDKILEEMQ